MTPKWAAIELAPPDAPPPVTACNLLRHTHISFVCDFLFGYLHTNNIPYLLRVANKIIYLSTLLFAYLFDVLLLSTPTLPQKGEIGLARIGE